MIEAVRDARASRATTAEHVWPVEERWIVCTDYDLTSTYIACDAEAAQRLLDHNLIEAVLIDRSTRIDNSAEEQR